MGAERTGVRVAARASADLRCALCHDALGRAARVCPGCGAALHAECAASAGGCPSLGCARPVRLEAPVPEPARSRLLDLLRFAAACGVLSAWGLLVLLPGVALAEGSTALGVLATAALGALTVLPADLLLERLLRAP